MTGKQIQTKNEEEPENRSTENVYTQFHKDRVYRKNKQTTARRGFVQESSEQQV